MSKEENMKNKWQTVKLGDVCEIQSGGTPSRSKIEYWKDGNIPWVKIGDFSDKYISKTSELITQLGLENSSAKLFTKGTLLYSIFATLGEVSILNIDATTNQAIAGLKIKNNNQLDINYLFSYLKSIKDEVNRIGRGVAQNNINLGILKQFAIPLPPLETQQKIAAVLDKVQKIISKSKTTLEKYDTLIKSRFIEMFGDPVQNPMGWEVKKLGNICSKISDGVHAKPEYTSTGKPFISVVNINSGKLLFDDCKYVSEEAYEKMIKSTHPEKGDVLYTKVGATYGIPALVDTDKDFCLYVSVALLKPKSEIVNSQFLTISMAQPYIKNQADKRIKGIGVPDLHLNQIREFDILLPPLELQNQFKDFVQQIDKSKFAVQKSLEKAETLYKSLMQQYFA